jgi:two-component system, LuxR family, sensor kinase FixL
VKQPANGGVVRYGIAITVTVTALGLRLLLEPLLGTSVPYLQFFPAILLAAWYGGFGPGALATGLGALIAMYRFLPPAGLAVSGGGEWLSLTLFIATGVGISWVNHRLRQAEAAQSAAALLATARAERLDAIINTTVDGIIVIGASGKIEAFNRGAERLFGYSESEVQGRNVNMLMPSPYHEEHDGYLQRFQGTREAHIIGTGREVSGRRRDGSVFPLHLSVGEMTIGGDQKFTGMLHDLSRRVQLENQLRGSEGRWRAIVESAVDGIIVIDRHGRIEAFNPAAERLFGYTEQDVMGQNVDMLMPSPYREEHDHYLSRYMATGRAKIIGIGREVTGRRQDGTTFPLHLSVGEISMAGERRFTGILHDLSARVRVEEQLREQAALAKLGEMAAVIAHEVKNPLAGIRGAMQVMGRRMTVGSMDEQMTREIVNRIDSLDAMMKDMLVFARPPKPKRLPIDIAPLIARTANLLSEDAAMRDVELHIDGAAPLVSGDAEMLTMVFQNLLVNGVQAMNGRGTIRVEIAPVSGACRIVFTDTGPGIPPDIRAKIFTPFFTTKSRGTGLGLPTAKRFVEAQDGQISIDCPPEGGTAVQVTLPLHAA